MKPWFEDLKTHKWHRNKQNRHHVLEHARVSQGLRLFLFGSVALHQLFWLIFIHVGMCNLGVVLFQRRRCRILIILIIPSCLSDSLSFIFNLFLLSSFSVSVMLEAENKNVTCSTREGSGLTGSSSADLITACDACGVSLPACYRKWHHVSTKHLVLKFYL